MCGRKRNPLHDFMDNEISGTARELSDGELDGVVGGKVGDNGYSPYGEPFIKYPHIEVCDNYQSWAKSSDGKSKEGCCMFCEFYWSGIDEIEQKYYQVCIARANWMEKYAKYPYTPCDE